MKTIKRLSLCALFALCSLYVSAYDFSAESDCVTFYYNILSSSALTCEVTYESTSYNSYSGSVTIPETVVYNNETYSVVRVGDSAFRNCSNLTSITIPNSVTEIQNYAFYYCSGLTGELKIPDSVTTIGNHAFGQCSGLTSLNLGNGVETIGEWAFYWCSGLTGELKIPDSVTTIGNYAFEHCSGLTSLNLGNSVEKIGERAFSDCSGLTSLTFGNSVKTIGERAFYWCLGLTGELKIPDSVTTMGYGAFSGTGITEFEVTESNEYFCVIDGVLFSKDKTTLIAFPPSSPLLPSYDIPNNVTTIGDYAFSNCDGLLGELKIPDSVTTIGDYAFAWCYGLTSLTLGNNVKTVGEWAFAVCSGLTGELKIPDSMTSIGGYAFGDCTGLTSLILNNNMETIGDAAFSGCSGFIGELKITDSVIEICESAFSHCEGLSSVTFGNNVATIGRFAFRYCSGLTGELKFPDSVTKIGESAFENCSSLTSITLGNGVTTIVTYAFYKCSSLTKFDVAEDNQYFCDVDGVLFSKDMTTLVQFPLSSPLLPSYEIPNGVSTIENYAFAYCTGLNSVTIGSSMEKIETRAFSFCTALTEVLSLNPTPPSCATYAFMGVDTSACVLYVPKESIETYSTTAVWEDFYMIKDIETSGIETLTPNDAELEIVGYYSIDGKQLNAPQKGINIVKFSDGTSKKVMVK